MAGTRWSAIGHGWNHGGSPVVGGPAWLEPWPEPGGRRSGMVGTMAGARSPAIGHGWSPAGAGERCRPPARTVGTDRIDVAAKRGPRRVEVLAGGGHAARAGGAHAPSLQSAGAAPAGAPGAALPQSTSVSVPLRVPSLQVGTTVRSKLVDRSGAAVRSCGRAKSAVAVRSYVVVVSPQAARSKTSGIAAGRQRFMRGTSA
jgi:hypothetical protein